MTSGGQTTVLKQEAKDLTATNAFSKTTQEENDHGFNGSGARGGECIHRVSWLIALKRCILVVCSTNRLLMCRHRALCIDCQHFFHNQLYDTFHALGEDVMELNFVPFGNAQLDELSQSVKCQHGEAECDANTWEQCAVEQTIPRVYMEFLNCLEQQLPMGHNDEPFPDKLYLGCAALTDDLDDAALQKCHDNPMLRWQLQQKYAHLTPEHDYVPWVLVNGKKIDEEKDDLLQLVCQEYTASGGTAAACKQQWF
jgi:interferon gamma-inducible protein 30